MQLRSDGEHTLNLSFHLSGWNPLPPFPSVKDFTGFRKSILLLPGLQRKQSEDGKQQRKSSAVEFWQHLRSTFSLYTDTYWYKLIMISCTFSGFTSTYLIYTEIKCSRAQGGTGKHFSITEINHLHYKLPYRWCWAKAAENHSMNWLPK